MRWLKLLLYGAASIYPLWWTASFVVNAAPALVSVAALGHRLADFRASPRWVFAASVPAQTSEESFASARRRRPAEDAVILTTIVAAAGLASLLLRRNRAIAGAWIACLGALAFAPTAALLAFRPRTLTPSRAVAALIFAGILLLAMHRMIAGQPRFLQRLGVLLAGLVLPLALLVCAAQFPERPNPVYVAIHIVPASLGALLVSILPRRDEAQSWREPNWRPVAAGLVLSLLLGGALAGADASAQRRAAADKQARIAALPKPDPRQPYPKLFFQRGVNFTAEFPGGYNSTDAPRMLDKLKQFGVDAIALVPYGFTRRGTTTVRFPGGMESDEGVEILSAEAHRRGMRVLLKPQIWTDRGFPGDLDFAGAEQRRQWYAQYRLFLEHYAKLATRVHADLFCVGVELAKLTTDEAQWRSLIARARELYPGPLVYAAIQGPEFEGIRFWDALDYIGLNNYYPLPDDLATQGVVEKVETVQKKFQRPVIFTEAGYSSLEAPHRQPWDETPRKLSTADQARCYEALFRAFYLKPWFHGMYWWKVGTNGFGGPGDGSHTPWGKPAMEVVGKWYLRGGRL